MKDNPKSFWKYVRSMTKSRIIPGELRKYNGEMASTEKSKAQTLNGYYQMVFMADDTSMPEAEFKEVDKDLRRVIFDQEAVAKKIKTLRTASAAGPNEIHPRQLKEASNKLVEPLTRLFQFSIDKGTLPYEWQLANVTPIFKKGN